METDLSKSTQIHCIYIPQVTSLLQKITKCKLEKSMNRKWQNLPEDGAQLKSTIGKKCWESGSYRQKELIETGDIDHWNFKLLIHLIRKVNFNRESDFTTTDKQLIFDLAQTYFNFLNDPKNSISNAEFDSFCLKVKEILTEFAPHVSNFENKPTQKLSSQMMVESYKSAGNDFYITEKFQDAINCYTEALKIPNSTTELIGKLYSNRSAAQLRAPKAVSANIFVRTYNDKINKKEISALEDAKLAVHFCPNWGRAHNRLGCAYMKKLKYSKAIKEFNMAIELGEKGNQVMEGRTKCQEALKTLETVYELNPSAQCATEIGTRQQIIILENLCKTVDRGRALAIRAHRYALGIDVSVNHEKSIELYEESAKTGFSEALYCLGVFYMQGKIVSKDLAKSVAYFREASKKPIKVNTIRNVGVSESQYQLGLMHHKGIAFLPDMEEALTWYEKSSLNFDNMAPASIGLMYFKGSGVERNEAKCLQYWNIGAERGNNTAMLYLAGYYLRFDLDGDNAIVWFRRALESGNLLAKDLQKEFELEAERLKTMFKTDADMIKWENRLGYSDNDCSMKERRRRYLESIFPDDVQYHKKVEESRKKNPQKHLPNDWRDFKTLELPYDIDMLSDYADKGSVTAQCLKEAMNHWLKGFRIISEKGKMGEAIHELAECFRITEKFPLHTEKIFLMTAALKELLPVLPPGMHSQLDKDYRVCFVMVLTSRNELRKTIAYLSESSEKYPNDRWFLTIRAAFLGFFGEHKEGCRLTDESLRKFPNDVKLLYLMSGHMRQRNDVATDDIIKAHEKFLVAAPKDHPKVPEAYYSIAIEYMNKMIANSAAQIRNKEKVIENYLRGMQAEKDQLPCFLPYDTEQKLVLESLPFIKPYSLIEGNIEMPEPRYVKVDKKEVKRNEACSDAKMKNVGRGEDDITFEMKLNKSPKQNVSKKEQAVCAAMQKQSEQKVETPNGANESKEKKMNTQKPKQNENDKEKTVNEDMRKEQPRKKKNKKGKAKSSITKKETNANSKPSQCSEQVKSKTSTETKPERKQSSNKNEEESKAQREGKGEAKTSKKEKFEVAHEKTLKNNSPKPTKEAKQKDNKTKTKATTVKDDCKQSDNKSKQNKAQAEVKGEDKSPKKENSQETTENSLIKFDKRRFEQLTNPRRVFLIADHRKMIEEMKTLFPNCVSLGFTWPSVFRQCGPPQLAEVKTITLREFHPVLDHVYEGYFLSCTVIDEPQLGFQGVQVLIEDENGDAERICVYNVVKDESIYDILGFGCNLTILNPYYRNATVDGRKIIRIDDPQSIIVEKGSRDLCRCRFCGKSRCEKRCGRCQKAYYCSEECQHNDWKIYRHSFVCIKR